MDVKLWYLSIILLLFVSCGKKEEDDSKVKVTNGVPIKEEQYPSVIKLLANLPTGEESIATMTFVTPNIALTAAHVIEGKENLRFLKDGEEITPSKFYTNEYFSLHQEMADKVAADLAFIEFPLSISMPTSSFSLDPIQKEDEVTIIGFGNNDSINNTGLGVKRKGTNKYADEFWFWKSNKHVEVDNELGIIRLTGEAEAVAMNPAGENSAATSGDSGCPLLINNRGNESIVGVNSSGNTSVSDREETSFFVDLHSDSSKAFLSRAVAIKGFALPASCCSCTKKIFSNGSPVKEEKSFLIPAVGKANTESLCQGLNGVTHAIFEGDTDFVDGEQRTFVTENCSMEVGATCSTQFEGLF